MDQHVGPLYFWSTVTPYEFLNAAETIMKMRKPGAEHHIILIKNKVGNLAIIEGLVSSRRYIGYVDLTDGSIVLEEEGTA